jgi:Trk-type K+ transport system membrane component
MKNSIISFIVFIIIVAGGILYGSFYLSKKWKKNKRDKKIHEDYVNNLSTAYRNALKSNDRKKAIELGFCSVYNQFRFEELSFDTRLDFAITFFIKIIEETNKMDIAVPKEELNEIFKKVTHMDLMEDNDTSND